MKINVLSLIFFGSIVSLIGTMVGACLGVVIRKPSNRFLGAIVGFSGGLMLAVVVFELIPEAMSNWSFTGTLFFCVLGIMVIMLLDRMLILGKWFNNTHVRVAFMAAMGLMVHNLPEGIIMGCGFLATQGLGIKMSIIISIHDIPEGMAVAAPLMANRTRISKIMLYAFLAAFPTAIGVWIGAYLGSISENVLGGCLSFASGIMLYVVCGEMLPESSKLWDGITSTMGVLTGIITGLIITNVI
jgi:zinc transporter, ZIP family